MEKKFKIYVVFGEVATNRYFEGNFEDFRIAVESLQGEVVCREFETEAEMKAYVKGIDDADGWLDYAVIADEDVKKHPGIIQKLSEL